MHPQLLKPNSFDNQFADRLMEKERRYFAILLLPLCLLITGLSHGQWTPLTNQAPNANLGVMLLLSNGTVMCKSDAGGDDGIGNTWNLLTPDSHGSYANGTWSTLAPMAKTRLYFSSQVLKDGRVFVAGGEYGTGGNYGEVYDPVKNKWSGEIDYGTHISDANSEILPDGKVLVSPVESRPHTFIWNPADNTYVAGPDNLGNTNESAWVKLPDNSILFIQTLGTQSERYIPSSNKWQNDAEVPVALYESRGAETGAGLLLPDGRAFFIGGNSNTAYYTPSGNAKNGTWTAGPQIPNSQSAPDAGAAMMRDGKILCAVSPDCCDVYTKPTSFYVFDYAAGANGTFTRINAPAGGLTTNIATYYTNMLDLPNGQILYCELGNSQYYVYTPGAQLSANQPAISNIAKHTDGSFTLTGTQINGWSEGAGYGDDWQMNTNYPIVQLTNGSNVYYARTYNWSSTGVRTGATSETAEFTLPAGLPVATYSLRVIANGVASDAVSFSNSNSSDNKAPVVTITSPANNTTYTAPATITINATATDSDGTVSSVKFYNGSTYLKTDFTSPYSYTISNLPSGTYSLTAKATDNKGAQTVSAPVKVTVNKAPAVSITSPADNTVYNAPATITIKASASDEDGTVASVKFYNGTTYLKTDFTSPYSYTLSNLPAGTYSLTAKATDNSGAQTISAAVTVKVTATNKAPTVRITSPANNSTYTAPAAITVNALAADADGSVYSVKFYNSTTYLKTVFASPYTYTISNLPAGTYSLTAKATDNNGAQTISAPVTVTVSDASIVSSKPYSENKKTALNDALSLRLAPNPASNIVNIFTSGLQQSKPATLSVISLSGIVLKTINISNPATQLDVSLLVSGVYTIKIISGDKIVWKQFMKL